MEKKKNDQVNLEKNRGLYFQVGLLFALCLAFVAFEWQTTPQISNVASEQIPIDFVAIDIPVTRYSPVTPPPAPQSGLILDIIDNDVVIDGVPEIIINVESGYNIIQPAVFTAIEIVEEEEAEIFCANCVEEYALFNGKPVDDAFRDYVSQNLKYPQIAADNGITGKVYIQFVVDPKGKVVDIKVIRGIDPLLERETLRLVESTSGMWTPGKHRGKPVKVSYTFPIAFQL